MVESRTVRRWAISVFTVGFLLPPSLAAERSAPRSDLDLAQRIETAISRDTPLHSAKLLVSVVDGVVVVGGSVDSLAQQQRLQELLRLMPGVRDSKVNTWIPRAERMVRKAEPRSEASSQTRLDPRPIANIVSHRYELPPLLLEPITTPQPRPSQYSPLPPPVPPAPSGPPEFPTIPPPAVPVVPKQDVAAAVEVVRASAPKYSGLKLDVKAGVVTISGTTQGGGEEWELAELVRKVPGIDRVIVGSVRGRY